MSAAITMSLIVGWFLGFVTYFGFKIGYKLLMEILEEEKRYDTNRKESI